MRIGVVTEPRLPGAAEFAREAEALGVDSLWVPEVWGYDALTGLAYLAAHTETIGLGTFVVQLGSRSPAMLATSALSVQELSGGRFTLGIGVSGPTAIEGWHGVRYTKPLQTTRETIEIVRMISRGDRLEHPGEIYPVPLPDGRGRGLRPLVAARELPVYVAAMGPRNLELTGEVADGWIGNAFMPEAADAFLTPLARGAERGGRALADLDLVAPVAVEVIDDPADVAAAARRHADGYAFTIGAMGSAGTDDRPATNYYAQVFARLGFETEVAEVARLWHAGDRDAARAAVPVEFGSRTNLVGTPEDIGERLRRYDDVGITTILAKLEGPFDAQLAILRTLLAIARETATDGTGD